jgi:branched-chain amino acid transport system substrate-binding protein
MPQTRFLTTMTRTVLCATVALAFAQCASAAEPLRIGVPVIFSGPGAFVGAAQKKTLEMQAEALNAAGGVGGRKVELVFYDTEGKPDVAVRMFNRLIKNDRVHAILGPSASWEAMPVRPIVEGASVPTVMLASTLAAVEPVSKCVYKTPPDDRIVVSRLLRYMAAANHRRVALVSSQDAFGDGGRKELLAQAKASGIEVVFDEKYTMEDADLSPLLNKIKRTNAQAVVNWSSSRAPVVMTTNYRQVGIELPLYHSHAVLSPAFLKATGAAAEGVMLAGPKLDAADALDDQDPQKAVIGDYRAKFRAKYNEEPNQFGAAAYDAMNILVAAIGRTGGDDAKLCGALEGTRGHVGVYGNFTYSAADHAGLTADSLVMYRAEGGAWKLVK